MAEQGEGEEGAFGWLLMDCERWPGSRLSSWEDDGALSQWQSWWELFSSTPIKTQFLRSLQVSRGQTVVWVALTGAQQKLAPREGQRGQG